MENVAQFIFAFYKQFFGGIWTMLKGVGLGLFECVRFPRYIEIIRSFTRSFGGWVIPAAILASLLLIAALAAAVYGIWLLIRKRIKLKRSLHTQEDLINEVNSLNREVMRLNLEKDKILSMKVSQIGLNPNEISELTGEEMQTLLEAEGGDGVEEGASRFFRLTKVDEEMASYVRPQFDDSI